MTNAQKITLDGAGRDAARANVVNVRTNLGQVTVTFKGGGIAHVQGIATVRSVAYALSEHPMTVDHVKEPAHPSARQERFYDPRRYAMRRWENFSPRRKDYDTWNKSGPTSVAHATLWEFVAAVASYAAAQFPEAETAGNLQDMERALVDARSAYESACVTVANAKEAYDRARAAHAAMVKA